MRNLSYHSNARGKIHLAKLCVKSSSESSTYTYKQLTFEKEVQAILMKQCTNIDTVSI